MKQLPNFRTQVTTGPWTAWKRLVLSALIGGLCAACATARGHIPEMRRPDDRAGFKMLKPAARAEACITAFPWSGAPDLAGQAFGRLLEVDDEATTVLNAELTLTWRSYGVVERHCAAIRGDVVRSAPAILLPMHHVHASEADD